MNPILKDALRKSFIVKLYKKTPFYKNKLKKKLEKIEVKKKLMSASFNKEAAHVLKKFSDALNAEGITFWLEFGTLLGYYREHDFISHDCDMDTGAYLEDAERVNKVLTRAGFTRCRKFTILDEDGLEECYKHKDYKTTIDVMYFRKKESTKEMYCNLFNSVYDMSKESNQKREVPFTVMECYFPIMDFVKADFKGCQVNVPIDCAQHLAYHYGDSFMIPNPNFSGADRLHLVKFDYKDKKGIGVMNQGYLE